MKLTFSFVCIMSVLALVACNKKTVSVTVVKQSNQCSNQIEQSVLLESSLQIEGLFTKKLFLGKGNDEDTYDFNKWVYIFVGAGSKTSSGYRYEMLGSKLSIRGDKVILPLTLFEPQAGYGQAQMITSPCVLLRVEKFEVDSYLGRHVEFVLQ